MSEIRKIKLLLCKYWPCYFLAFLSIAIIKYRYSSVDVELLVWILRPTAWWAGILTGDPFPWHAGRGYVSHSYQFVIANTCSGIQFMMIVIAALVFGYVHQTGSLRKGLGWTVGSIAFSYVFTIFVNGVRIACAIFIPRRLSAGVLGGISGSMSGAGLTPERFHTVIGIVVYFASLLFIYELTGSGLQSLGKLTGDTKGTGKIIKSGIGMPVFWYFFVVLGIPFLNRAYERNREGFTEYSLLLLAVCPVVLAVYWGIRRLGRKKRNRPDGRRTG